MNRSTRVLIFLFSLLMLACSDNSGSSAFQPPPQAPQRKTENAAVGSVNGHPWSFVQGRAMYREKNGYVYLEVGLWDQSFDNPCELIRGSGRQVRLQIEPKVLDWNLEDYGSFVIYPLLVFSDYYERAKPADNMVAQSGQISIESVSTTKITGYVEGRLTIPGGVGNEVSGRFEVNICPLKFPSKP